MTIKCLYGHMACLHGDVVTDLINLPDVIVSGFYYVIHLGCHVQAHVK